MTNANLHQAHVPVADRYAAYMTLYNNLDTILWQVPTYMLGLLVAGGALFGKELASIINTNVTFGAATLPGSVLFALLSTLVSLVFVVGVYTIHRLRYHHSLVGKQLFELEQGTKSSYFTIRQTSANPRMGSAPRWFQILFGIVAIAFALPAVVLSIAGL